MTQLFDTETYEDTTPAASDVSDAANGTSGTTERHLRSIRLHLATGPDVSPPQIRWQLDDHTIETGRRGIQAARQALQDAARDTAEPTRKAA